MKKIKTWLLPNASEGWEAWVKQGDEFIMEDVLLDPLSKLDDSTCLMVPVEHTACSLEQVFSGELETDILSVETIIESKSSDELSHSQIGVYQARELEEGSIYMGVTLLDSLVANKNWMEAQFDYSPRARSFSGDLAFWQEHGKWVYACYIDDVCVYSNVLPGVELSSQLIGLMPMIEMRLGLLGLEYKLERAVVEADAEYLNVDQCSQYLGCELKAVSRDQILLLESNGLNYLPKVVEQARLRKKQKTKQAILACLLMCCFLGVGYMVFEKRRGLIAKVDENEKIIKQYSPAYNANDMHYKKMEELEALTTEKWPLDVYSELVRAMPEGERRIRIESVITRQNTVEIVGRAANFASANAFGDNIQNNSYFEDYSWKTPPANQSLNRSHWKFQYKGTISTENYE